MADSSVNSNFTDHNSNHGRKRNVQECLEDDSEQDSQQKRFKQSNGDSRLQDSMEIEGNSGISTGDISVFQPPSRSLITDDNELCSQRVGENVGGSEENVGGSDPDPPLPKELLEKFEPMCCKLCELQMTSNAMATMHYKSKNHEKKIRKFLLDDAEEKAVFPHPYALRTRPTTTSEDKKNPKYFHCDVCDLPLTGKLHAESHYMGKHHNAVVMGSRSPSGTGSYDPKTGKWKREKPQSLKYDGYNDNIGLAFRTAAPSLVAETKLPLKCSFCEVICTGQVQMKMHLNGIKHRKKLRSMGVRPEDVGLSGENTETDVKPDPGTLSSEFSRYKTPSGQFYCKKCNLSLNTDLQLTQHLNSKNHAKKST